MRVKVKLGAGKREQERIGSMNLLWCCHSDAARRCRPACHERPNTESAESVTQRLQQQQHCHGNSNDMLTYVALRTRARTPHPTASLLSSSASATAVALTAAQYEREREGPLLLPPITS
ncbi:unnamed protein product [Acanthocheilonema viteae]|uniref:Uncharacterized protein n=1 Tax=Acanthocheilonema viteae TaxID=6277 RepID=A0A498SJ53_ACAVI|nr:unnamed protein product [Acanthocheilonema viteae]